MELCCPLVWSLIKNKMELNTDIIDVQTAKRPYISPSIEVIILEIECSIASGSAYVSPHNQQQQIYEQWDVEVDDNRGINF